MRSPSSATAYRTSAFSPHVDRVFAKRYLAKYCRKRGIDFFPYDTFQDVRNRLQAEFQAD